LGNIGNTCDRFLSSGYKEQLPKAEMYKKAASIPGVEGIELVGSWDITSKNIEEVKKNLEGNSLKCICVIPDHFAQKIWGKGAFTSREGFIREKAIEVTKEAMDIAKEIGCELLNIWPGQDGYDYCFQGNFIEAREQLIDGIRECCDYNKDIRIALEYKPKEPRTHSYLARAADTLLVVKEIDRPNVGITIDTGHALMGYENIAESVGLIAREGKLFHLHFNDNYRAWDDDMIVGSVHTVEFIELLYWLKKLNYSGWYSMDQYPYREDGASALGESIAWLKALDAKIEAVGMDVFDKLIKEGDAVKVSSVIRELLLDK
jgi:xylose isomerase